MNKQVGFIGVIVVFICLLILGAVSYRAYTVNTFGVKDLVQTVIHKESANQNTAVSATSDNTVKPEIDEKTTTGIQAANSATETKANCATNTNCLITAASQCQSAEGRISTANIPDPLIKGLLHAGTIKYAITANSSACVLTYTSLAQSFSLSVEGRAAMKKQGATDAQIDAQLKVMNDSVQSVLGQVTTCTGTAAAVSSYLTDQKNGYMGEVNASAGLESSKSEITTSSGEKLTCVSK